MKNPKIVSTYFSGCCTASAGRFLLLLLDMVVPLGGKECFMFPLCVCGGAGSKARGVKGKNRTSVLLDIRLNTSGGGGETESV